MTNLQIIFDEVQRYRSELHELCDRTDRVYQLDQITDALLKNFDHKGPINIIETGASQHWMDGMLGLMLARISQRTGGKMWMVDIDPNSIKNSIEIFALHGITCVEFVVEDSVTFLQSFAEDVHIVHLDSWDLNLKDPFPAAFHGWREFDSIKDKVSNDTIVIIDDNYVHGTWVEWNYFSNGQIIDKEFINIEYPFVGKGVHVWWWIQQPQNDWKLLSDGVIGSNFKLICKKT
jgi:hypothetical protein